MTTTSEHDIHRLLKRLYGAEKGAEAFAGVQKLIQQFDHGLAQQQRWFDQSDVVLITYGDTLQAEDQAPLKTLHAFANRYLRSSFSAVHLLPFFPFSSDDGFSVIDYLAVNPKLGDWDDVRNIGEDFDLMIDFVLNHVSAQSPWFENYLAGRPGYAELALEADPKADISMVTRPRTLPLLTSVTKASGERVHVWTTFSADQIDLNYKSIEVLLKMIEVLLFYVKQGARIIRLDAVAYLWKKLGTPCIHLPETHDMVHLLRTVLDQAAPGTWIVTETNVPHLENISYFGNGYNEAHMVYNFALPPLLLHAFLMGDGHYLTRWAKNLRPPSEATAFFNFTASHDGIGVRPLEGLVPDEGIARLAELALMKGGQVSCKQNSDGSKSPYELNVTYVDALGGTGRNQAALHPARFLASQAIALVLPGVPAVYVHSILGSHNWRAGARLTGRARTINRQPLNLAAIEAELKDASSFRARIFNAYRHMLQVRRAQPAFHPNAAMEVLSPDSRLFVVKRHSGDQELYALTNISDQTVELSLKSFPAHRPMRDILSNRDVPADLLTIQPYENLWLSA